jgi:hypothetical protein
VTEHVRLSLGVKRFLLVSALLLLLSNHSVAENWVLFLDQKKRVGPQIEWNREIVARKPGVIRCRIESEAPLGVTLVAERTYRAILRGDPSQMKAEDVLITSDSHKNIFERQFSVPTAGRSGLFFKIKAATRLKCICPALRRGNPERARCDYLLHQELRQCVCLRKIGGEKFFQGDRFFIWFCHCVPQSR